MSLVNAFAIELELNLFMCSGKLRFSAEKLKVI